MMRWARRFSGDRAPGKRPAGDQRGFSLLEVLIALVLTGSVVVALLQLTRAQMDSQQAAMERLTILDRAGELMSQWLSAPQVNPGVYQGEGGDVSWTVEVLERKNPSPLPRMTGRDRQAMLKESQSWEIPTDLRNDPADILAVKVCGRWSENGRTKELCLESERIAPVEQSSDLGVDTESESD